MLKDVKRDNAIVDPNVGFIGKRDQRGIVQYQQAVISRQRQKSNP